MRWCAIVPESCPPAGTMNSGLQFCGLAGDGEMKSFCGKAKIWLWGQICRTPGTMWRVRSLSSRRTVADLSSCDTVQPNAEKPLGRHGS